jgi:hypothetical protein
MSEAQKNWDNELSAHIMMTGFVTLYKHFLSFVL